MDKTFYNLLDTTCKRIDYLTWISKQHKCITDQIERNLSFIQNNEKKEQFETSCLYSIISKYIHQYVTFIDYDCKLIKTRFLPTSYVLNIKMNTCSCLSFKYNNYKIKGSSCKHLQHYCKINELLLMISLIYREYLYGIDIPIKKMIDHCML